jgi:hypothetical protein
MNNLKVRLFMLTALVCGVFFLANCSSTPTTTTTTTNSNTAVVVNKPADAPKTTDAPKTETADKIGVAECDEYIQKWEACVNSKVPEAQRSMYKPSFETLRKSWKDAAANPQGKEGLKIGCKQALDSAKQTYSAYGCAW